MRIRKLLVLGLFIAIVAGFIGLDMGQYFSLDLIKSKIDFLQAFHDRRTLPAIVIFMAVFMFLVSFCLPGTAVLTLLAGSVFGVLPGTVFSALASTTGATIAFFLSRFLFHDTLENRFPRRIASMKRGVKREGAFYLFSLRLVPIVPFLMINPLMGLTGMNAGLYFIITLVGMLPHIALTAYAGRKISEISSPSELLTPQLLLLLLALALFPFLARGVIMLLRRLRQHLTS